MVDRWDLMTPILSIWGWKKIKGGIIKSHNEFTILNVFERGEEKFTATGKGIHGILSFFDYGSFSPTSD